MKDGHSCCSFELKVVGFILFSSVNCSAILKQLTVIHRLYVYQICSESNCTR